VTATLRQRPPGAGTGNGGVPARRAVIRWAWRMFRREWRQQLLVLALIIVAVAATIVGAAVATNTPPPASSGFGAAHDQAILSGGPRVASQVAALRHRFGPVDVIENQAISIPGSIDTYDLRAQNPRGPFGQPMLALVSGHYPVGPGQVAVTGGVASAFRLHIGSVWRLDGIARTVVGTVQNPQSLLDEFALVAPGQVTHPSQVTVLFNAPGVPTHSIGPGVQTPASVQASNPLNPETIVLGLATVGMLLIALVAVGGFTVLAQRRLRALGMLGSLGATDRNVGLVVRANGAVVGVVGALAGGVLGLAAWLAYRPRVEADAHHLIPPFQLPWVVIAPAMTLAVVATYFAAARPARAITRIPVVSALSGRPAPPKQTHRSAIPGVVALVVAAAAFGYVGQNVNGGGGPVLILAFVALIAAVVLLCPVCLAMAGRAGRRAPVSVRLALRDLARYRARSGSALAAISIGVLAAMMVCILSAQRYGNVLDYAGPNLASNQVIVYAPGPQQGGPGAPLTGSKLRAAAAHAQAIAAGLGSHDLIQLESTSASLTHAAPGRNWSGPVYVATPRLLHAFGIKGVNPSADILTMRPGLSGISRMQLTYGPPPGSPGNPGGPGGPSGNSFPCPKTSCLLNPVIQQVSALPSGTSAPNTVLTEHAVHQLHLSAAAAGWLITTPRPPTAAQITSARQAAATAGLTIETKSSAPSSSEIITWATVFGIALALGILAMSVGLIRSETASDRRTLAATGASSWSRRTITAATAGGLAVLGALLGTVAAYVGVIAFSWDNSLDGLSELSSVPTTSLLVILVGMPLAAVAAGWLLAGREPRAIAHQPIE
jgi:putative ABC transport system permease protein